MVDAPSSTVAARVLEVHAVAVLLVEALSFRAPVEAVLLHLEMQGQEVTVVENQDEVVVVAAEESWTDLLEDPLDSQ